MMRLVCPRHGMPDCSPLLNGCSLVIRAHDMLDVTVVENVGNRNWDFEICVGDRRVRCGGGKTKDAAVRHAERAAQQWFDHAVKTKALT